MKLQKPIAVVDTNVLLSVMSCMHAANHSDKPGWSMDSAVARADRAKARQAVILSWHLHELGASTFSLWEPLRKIRAEIPVDGADAVAQSVILWVNYVRVYVTPNWNIRDPNPEAPVFDAPEDFESAVRQWCAAEPTGDDADQLHVDKAKEFGVPVITFEGLKEDGTISDRKSYVRKRAKVVGVQVMTPAEFYAGRDERLTCGLFHQAFRDRASAFLKTQTNREPLARSLELFEGYYRHILFGEAEGRSEPLPVTF